MKKIVLAIVTLTICVSLINLIASNKYKRILQALGTRMVYGPIIKENVSRNLLIKKELNI